MKNQRKEFTPQELRDLKRFEELLEPRLAKADTSDVDVIEETLTEIYDGIPTKVSTTPIGELTGPQWLLDITAIEIEEKEAKFKVARTSDKLAFVYNFLKRFFTARRKYGTIAVLAILLITFGASAYYYNLSPSTEVLDKIIQQMHDIYAIKKNISTSVNKIQFQIPQLQKKQIQTITIKNEGTSNTNIYSIRFSDDSSLFLKLENRISKLPFDLEPQGTFQFNIVLFPSDINLKCPSSESNYCGKLLIEVDNVNQSIVEIPIDILRNTKSSFISIELIELIKSLQKNLSQLIKNGGEESNYWEPNLSGCLEGGLYCGNDIGKSRKNLFTCIDGKYNVLEECADYCINERCVLEKNRPCLDSEKLYCGSEIGNHLKNLYQCIDGKYQPVKKCSGYCELGRCVRGINIEVTPTNQRIVNTDYFPPKIVFVLSKDIEKHTILINIKNTKRELLNIKSIRLSTRINPFISFAQPFPKVPLSLKYNKSTTVIIELSKNDSKTYSARESGWLIIESDDLHYPIVNMPFYILTSCIFNDRRPAVLIGENSKLTYYILRNRKWLFDWKNISYVFEELEYSTCLLPDSLLNSFPDGPVIGKNGTMFMCLYCRPPDLWIINEKYRTLVDKASCPGWDINYDDVFDRAKPDFVDAYIWDYDIFYCNTD